MDKINLLKSRNVNASNYLSLFGLLSKEAMYMVIRVKAVWNDRVQRWIVTDDQTGEYLAEAATLAEIEKHLTLLLACHEDSGYFFSTRTNAAFNVH